MQIRIALIVALVFAGATQSEAQTSLDLTVGVGSGRGGSRNYQGAGALTGELTAAQGASRLYAATIGGRANPASNDKCELESATTFTCRPKFPSSAHVGALVGTQAMQGSATARAMIGPGLFFGGTTGIGGLLHLDAAVGLSHLKVVIAARGSAFRTFSGESFALGSFELGLRLQ
jgi:hypothetical protein